MSVEDTVPMRLRRTYLAMHRAAQSHFSQFGVTVDQYVLLSVLADEGGVTQSEIGEQMSSDANTIVAMLRLLEKKELIRRERCDIDGRARRVHLTVAGRRLHRKLVRSAEVIRKPIDQALSAKDCKTLFSMLDRIVSAIAIHGKADVHEPEGVSKQ